MKKYLVISFSFLLSVVSLKAQVEIVSAGTSAAYTLNVPGVFPLTNGIQVTFKAHTTCSASATMNVTGTGAFSIRKEGNTVPLTGGDIKAGQIVTLAFDGTNWQMLSNIGNSATSSVNGTTNRVIKFTSASSGGDSQITDDGTNVGIGTSTPAHQLELFNTINSTTPLAAIINGHAAGDGALRFTGGATHYSIGADNSDDAFKISNSAFGLGTTDRFTITSTGAVGIGTASPGATFEVFQSTNPQMRLKSSAGAGVIFDYNNTAFSILNYDNTPIYFATGGGSTKMNIQTNGNVGIGTGVFTPTAKLHVIGGARITDLAGPGTVIADASGNLSVVGGSTVTGTGTTNYLARWTSATQLGIGATFDNGTNVGIGTTSPTNILSFGNASDRKIWIESSSGNTVGRALTISSGNSGLGFNNVNGGDMIIQAGVGTGSGSSSILFQNGTTLGNSPTVHTVSTKMVILGNGNVGIGTTAPSQALDVVGNFQFTGALMPSGSTGTSGQVLQSNGAGAPSWVTLPTGSSAWTRTSPFIYTTTLTDNVGIGISNPGHPLQINENGQNPYIHFTDDITGTTMTDGLIMGTNGAGAMYILGQETTTHLNIGTPGANNLMRFWGTTDRISVDNAASPTSPSALFGVNNTGAETTTNYASIISNFATNTTTDGINKIGLQINNTGTFTGLAGTVTRNYGLFIGPMSGADENYSAVFQTGNVGIGTTTPTERLQVSGNVMIPAANNYLYATAKTDYISLSSASFTTINALAVDGNGTGNARWISSGIAGTADNMFATVNLPNGATITDIDVYVYDADATYEVTANLVRNTLASNTNSTLATTTGTGTTAIPGIAIVSATLSSVVDNSLYMYYLKFNTRQNNTNLWIRGAVITYTVLKAD